MKSSHSCRLCGRWLEGELNEADEAEQAELRRQMDQGHCDVCPTAPETIWWTFEELQAYLGHTRLNSTEVWCTRHNIRPVRHYRVADVLRERPPKRSPQP